jgi:hypothetical protein
MDIINEAPPLSEDALHRVDIYTNDPTMLAHQYDHIRAGFSNPEHEFSIKLESMGISSAWVAAQFGRPLYTGISEQVGMIPTTFGSYGDYGQRSSIASAFGTLIRIEDAFREIGLPVNIQAITLFWDMVPTGNTAKDSLKILVPDQHGNVENINLVSNSDRKRLAGEPYKSIQMSREKIDQIVKALRVKIGQFKSPECTAAINLLIKDLELAFSRRAGSNGVASMIDFASEFNRLFLRRSGINEERSVYNAIDQQVLPDFLINGVRDWPLFLQSLMQCGIIEGGRPIFRFLEFNQVVGKNKFLRLSVEGEYPNFILRNLDFETFKFGQEFYTIDELTERSRASMQTTGEPLLFPAKSLEYFALLTGCLNIVMLDDGVPYDALTTVSDKIVSNLGLPVIIASYNKGLSESGITDYDQIPGGAVTILEYYKRFALTEET